MPDPQSSASPRSGISSTDTIHGSGGVARLQGGGSADRTGCPFPDFWNLGTWLRTLIIVNGLALVAAMVDADRLADWPTRYIEYAWRLQPVLLLSLVMLSLSSRYLRRLPVWMASFSAVGGVVLITVLMEGLWRRLWLSDVTDMLAVLRLCLLSGMTAALCLHYFFLRHQIVRPAVDAAQVAALTARIRPHFLFNSLTAVLSLIRKEPKRAESALESLADLFRVLMRDPRDLVLLSEEISLSRQYLELERLRLGDRLKIHWAFDEVPGETLVPPLMLQPLLENAVYHGIEPAENGGTLRIACRRSGDTIEVEIRNSLPEDSTRQVHAVGNHMALTNIRQRLALYYDLEASLDVTRDDNEYCVTLKIPVERDRK